MAKGPLTGMGPADFAALEPKRPLQVYTARMGYKGADGLDITRSSGTVGQIFAPTYELLTPYLDKRRAGTLTPEDWTAYSKSYLEEMRASYRAHRKEWDAILAWKQATVLCFCVNASECHRMLLGRNILARLGAIYLGERQGQLAL